MYQVSEEVYIRRVRQSTLPGDEGDSKSKIGSSMKNRTSLRGLTAEEEKLYLPEIIGSNPNNPNWAKDTEEYWRSISVDVPNTATGLKLEIGWQYNTEKDRDERRKENGRPINVSDYVLYRYCLVYSRVANSADDIYKSPKIMFYIYNRKEEVNQQVSNVRLVQKAYAKYLEIVAKPSTIRNVLNLLKVGVGQKMSEEEQLIAIDSVVKNRPQDFLNVIDDSDFDYRVLIDKAVRAKHLTILPNTETYQYGDEVWAYSTKELIVKLKDENNKKKLQLEALVSSTSTLKK